MTKEQNELIDYLENLPKRGDILFSEDFQSDDYSTALGRLRKSINGHEPTREPLSENKEVCEHSGDTKYFKETEKLRCHKCLKEFN